MKHKAFLLALTSILVVSTAISATGNETNTSLDSKELEQLNLTGLETSFNANTGKLPSFVGSLIGDQTIAINLTNIGDDRGLLEENVIGIKTDGQKVSEIQWGEFNETTLKIWINQEDINQLMKSEQPFQKLKDMLKSGDIDYETYTFSNKVKMTLMQVFLLF